MSDPVRRVITAIVNEDQLSLAIGRNGQNVRLASQLIGWQVDLYGSREWIELGADLGLFEREAGEDDYESSDFALEELDLPRETLATLQNSGYSTFLQIIDFSKEDFVKIEGISEAESERLMELIEELTVLDGAVVSETEEVSQSDGAVVSETEESDKVEE
jgi:N utilization substance protein A